MRDARFERKLKENSKFVLVGVIIGKSIIGGCAGLVIHLLAKSIYVMVVYMMGVDTAKTYLGRQER